jgi:hypothetical protein
MLGLADVAGIPDVGSRQAFFDRDSVCQTQPLEMELQFAPNFYFSESQPVCTSIFRIWLGSIFSLAFFTSSSVAAFRGPNSDTRNGACFAVSRQASKIIGLEDPHPYSAYLSVRPNSSFEGERCMKDTVHPIVHSLVHRRIFGKGHSRRSCTGHDDQFGRGQNTGLGWSDPTFVHVSVPKVIRGVAPAQLRGDRAECFVRAAFRSRGAQ